ncbi:hypothetical protein NQZ68_041565 [Dissostichus eleginoides]|nr:hypothetical protein NQZ68_041565 [Dissostichus eleginoides]
MLTSIPMFLGVNIYIPVGWGSVRAERVLCVSLAAASGAWKQRAVEPRSGLQQQRHAGEVRGNPGRMPLRSRCLSLSAQLRGFGTTEEFPAFLRSVGGKKSQNRRVKSSHRRRRCSAYIPVKIPAVERRWAVKVSVVSRSIFPLFSGC